MAHLDNNQGIVHNRFNLSNGAIILALESKFHLSLNDRLISIEDEKIKWRITGIEIGAPRVKPEKDKILFDPKNELQFVRIKNVGHDQEIIKGAKYIIEKSDTHLESI